MDPLLDHTPEETVATTEVAAAPDISPTELAKLGGDNPVLVGLLAVVAILGGGTAFKFYNKKSAFAHELRMKELELKQTSPPSCLAKHAELDKRIGALEERTDQVARKTRALSVDGPSSEELDERLVRVEKDVKAIKAKKSVAK